MKEIKLEFSGNNWNRIKHNIIKDVLSKTEGSITNEDYFAEIILKRMIFDWVKSRYCDKK